MKFIIIRKQWIFFLAVLLFLAFASWYLVQPLTIFTSGETASPENKYTIHMVTGEFASKTEDGKELKHIDGILVLLLFQRVKMYPSVFMV